MNLSHHQSSNNSLNSMENYHQTNIETDNNHTSHTSKMNTITSSMNGSHKGENMDDWEEGEVVEMEETNDVDPSMSWSTSATTSNNLLNSKNTTISNNLLSSQAKITNKRNNLSTSKSNNHNSSPTNEMENNKSKKKDFGTLSSSSQQGKPSLSISLSMGKQFH